MIVAKQCVDHVLFARARMAQSTPQRDGSITYVVFKLGGNTQASILCSMFDDESSLHDVLLSGAPGNRIDGHELIGAHKAILARASPHLYDLFTIQGFVDSNKAKYTITDISHESLRDIVKIVYTNFVELQEDEAAERVRGILIGAKYLIMKDLVETCETFLAGSDRIGVQNCIDVFQFAFKYKCCKLLDTVCAFIGKNLIAVSQSDKFLNLTQDECAKFLLSEPVVAANANDRCRAAIAWLSYESPSRAESAECIMSMIALDADGVLPETLLLAAESVVIRPAIKGICLNLIDALASNLRRSAVVPAAHEEAEAMDGVIGSQGEMWYVLGGRKQHSYTSTKFYRYEVARHQWTVLPNLPWRRSGGTACAVGKRLVVMGGNKNNIRSVAIEEFDTVTQTWSKSKAKLSHVRSGLAVAADGSGHAYAMGGAWYDEISHNTKSAKRYTYGAQQLEKIPDMFNTRSCGAAACNVDNMVFVAGGFGGIREGWLCPDVEKYDHTTQKWSKITRLNRPRANLEATFAGDDLYLIAGNQRKYVDIVNTCTGQVRFGPELTHTRNGCSALTWDNNVVCVLGGHTCEKEELKSVEAYDVREGKWSVGVIVPDMPMGTSFFGCARVLF